MCETLLPQLLVLVLNDRCDNSGYVAVKSETYLFRASWIAVTRDAGN